MCFVGGAQLNINERAMAGTPRLDVNESMPQLMCSKSLWTRLIVSMKLSSCMDDCMETRWRTREPDGACESAYVRNDVGVTPTLENLS